MAWTVNAITIHFRRDPQFTMGPNNYAWCDVDGVRHKIERRERGNNGAALYRLIAHLAQAGYEGRPYVAHDGRMVCLSGTITRQSVPTQYGGTKGTTKTAPASLTVRAA